MGTRGDGGGGGDGSGVTGKGGGGGDGSGAVGKEGGGGDGSGAAGGEGESGGDDGSVCEMPQQHRSARSLATIAARAGPRQPQALPRQIGGLRYYANAENAIPGANQGSLQPGAVPSVDTKPSRRFSIELGNRYRYRCRTGSVDRISIPGGT